MKKIPFQFNDGGRTAAGFFKSPDCVVRAIAIAENISYKDAIKVVRDKLLINKGDYTARQLTAVRGVPQFVTEMIMAGLGYRYTQLGNVRFCKESIPVGRVVVRVRGHVAAVINGVLQDTWDCQKTGRRPLLGYWVK